MADEPQSLVLEHLRAIQGDASSLRDDMRDVKGRLNDIHSAVVGLRRDQVQDAETVAHMAARIDRLRDDVERINRRLDIGDA